ncbi:MAG: L,D-transpeptidase [Beijerinckiaceae bacterium]
MRIQNGLFRHLAVTMLAVVIAGCVGVPLEATDQQRPSAGAYVAPQIAALYAAAPEERFPIPEINFDGVDTAFLRRVVPFQTRERPGTVIISTSRHMLHLVLEGGMAVRYGVGKEGLDWTGRAEVGRKAEWPRWTPTADMIRRDPDQYARWSDGMEPGLDNPLGARALYLHRDGRDTLYRIHGTNDPASIGQSLSSGCIRMFNQDVVDLHNRVAVGASVIVGP